MENIGGGKPSSDGHPRQQAFLNLMLHPGVILLSLTCLCLLLITILYFKVWHMMKQIALMQSPRVCMLTTEGDKSLKLENFPIKDRKKFQQDIWQWEGTYEQIWNILKPPRDGNFRMKISE